MEQNHQLGKTKGPLPTRPESYRRLVEPSHMYHIHATKLGLFCTCFILIYASVSPGQGLLL